MGHKAKYFTFEEKSAAAQRHKALYAWSEQSVFCNHLFLLIIYFTEVKLFDKLRMLMHMPNIMVNVGLISYLGICMILECLH